MTSPQTPFIPLENRSLIKVTGEDAAEFLQGLITNDITLLDSQDSLYACMLTPQGKFLYEFFIFKDGDIYFLDTEKDRLAECLKRLQMYKLRAKVMLEADDSALCFASLDAKPNLDNSYIIPDPRHEQAGWRIYTTEALTPAAPFEVYDCHRIRLGLPDGARDITPERSTMAEARMDAINGVSYKKGCYVGQEVTARMHHRGLAKKQLIPVKMKGTLPTTGQNLVLEDKVIGEIRSVCHEFAMVLTRIEIYDKLKYDDNEFFTFIMQDLRN